MKNLYKWKLAETCASQHILDSPTFPSLSTIFHCLSLYIPNFLNFFSLLFAHSGKIFENRTFLYPLKLKNRKIHTNENKLKLVLLSKYSKQSTFIPLSLLHLHLLQMISPTFPLFSTIFHCFFYLFVISLISIPYCQHSGKFFEKRIFIYLPSWAQKLKNLYEWKIFENRTFA